MNNDDLISRSAAIDALESIGSLDTNADREYARSVFGTLPSAQPEIEPKTGHWIVHDDYDGEVYYTCSRCEEPWVTIEGTPQENRMRYCPNCGAKMEGEVK